MATDSRVSAADGREVGVGELFVGFLGLGLISFGGALPFVRRAVVEQRRWLSSEEFIDLLGLCQFLPGGNVINLSVAIGMRFRGAMGALAAITGFIAVPSLIVIALGVVYAKTQHDPIVHHMFGGLAAAAAGLLIAMAMKVAKPIVRSPEGIFVAAVIFAAIALVRLPLLPTMLVLTPLSIALAWRRQRRALSAHKDTVK